MLTETTVSPILFELQLSRTPTALEVRSFTPLMGQARETITLLPRKRIPRSANSRALSALGQTLYQSLIVGQVRTALEAARNQARTNQTTVTFQLRFDKDAVADAQYPWELLHDGLQFLLLSGVALTRYITFPHPVIPVKVEPPLRVLLVTSSPKDLPPLQVRSAQETLAELTNVDMEVLEPPTYRNLLRRLRSSQAPVHAFAFEGHGGVVRGMSGLCFEDESGQFDLVMADELGVALSDRQVALAVLNACHGADVDGVTLFNGVAPALVLAGIPAVIGMQGTITDDAAVDFQETLYEGIGHCLPVTKAVADARRSLYRSQEWYKPVLYLRSTDPEGKILEGCIPEGPNPDKSETKIPVTLPDGRESVIIAERTNPARLRAAMESAFSAEEFAVLCFELGVNPANLVGETLQVKLMSLIQWHQQRSVYARLILKVLEERPNLWEQLMS